MMWSKIVESLQGVRQPEPSKGAKISRPIMEREYREAAQEARKKRKLSAQEKEDKVLAILKERGKITTSELTSLRLGMSYDVIISALGRLRFQNKVRLVDAKPYWEVIK